MSEYLDSKHRATVPRGIRTPEPLTTTMGGGQLDTLAALLGLTMNTSNTHVSETTVVGLPGIQSGIDMIAHAVATMMTEAKVFDADGNEIEDRPPIVERPSPLYGTFEFYTMLVDMLMKRGNAPGILADYDRDGYPRQIVPVHPDAANLDQSTGLPVYTMNNSTYDWSEVFHVRHGAPWGSLWGQGIIERFRTGLQGQLAQQEFGRTSYMNGGVPSVHVQLEKANVTDDEAEAVDTRWGDRFGSGMRKPLVTGKAIAITPITWKPEDMEYIESLRVTVGLSALICGLHPADLGASLGGSLDYANLTDRQLSRVLQSFSPWMRLIEEEMSDQLPGGQYVRGDIDALLRTSPMERFEWYALGESLGIFTRPELREMERRPKLPEEDIKPPAPVVVMPPQADDQTDDETDDEETAA